MEREDIFQEDPRGRNPLALEQGTLVRDQFRLGRVLGVGGFGITYLAFDEVLEMVVAVKEYLPNNIAVREAGSQTVQPFSKEERSDFEFGLERFLREARMLAKFEEHPNIVRVRTFFEANGTGYLVMNYYEGRTLREYLTIRNDFILESEALLVMEEVIEGLGAVHEKDVLHRDIDPSNVYLADNGKVVLLDFGAARAAVGERTRDMSVVLKRGYAPYEQYHSQGDQGPWTDVYACSATLYRTLTGYKPPEATARVMDEELVAPKELVPSLSDATNEAVIAGLAVQPDDRPQSIQELAEMLPETSRDTVPGWELDGMGGSATAVRPEGATAELEIVVSHACRLYVDGVRRAEVPADTARTIEVQEGTHRLRAVRIDRPTADSATVTMSSSGAGAPDEAASNVGLDSILWKSVVTVARDERTPLTVDFGADGATRIFPGTETTSAPDDRPPATPDGQPVASPESAPTPALASANGDREADGGSEGTLSFMQVWTDQPCDLFVNGIPETTLETEADQWVAVRPGKHKVRAEAIGGTAVWEHDIKTEPNRSTTVTVALDRTGSVDREERRLPTIPTDTVRTWMHEHAVPWGRTIASHVASRELRMGVIGVVGLILGGLVLWGVWPGSGEATPGRQTPVGHKIEAKPDRVVTMGGTVVDVLENDRGPGREVMAVQSARALSNDIERVEVVDASRIRIQPAPNFAGEAKVQYTVATLAGTTAQAQVSVGVPFGTERRVVTREAEGPQIVHAVPLTDNGTPDLVVASYDDDRVGWIDNRRHVLAGAVDSKDQSQETSRRPGDPGPVGSARSRTTSTKGQAGYFGPLQTVTASADGALAVQTADLSGNGHRDLLFGAERGDRVAWCENQGDGSFGPVRTLSTTATGVISVHAADLTGDDRPDVVVGTRRGRRVTWYRNRGQGEFGPARTLVHGVNLLGDVHVADITNDDHPDILVASFQDDVISWYRNQGEEGPLQFGRRRILADDVDGPIDLHTADLTGNGRPDVLASAAEDRSILWFKNRRSPGGTTILESARYVAKDVAVVEDLATADLGSDGDSDLFAAAFDTNQILWIENEGEGTFAAPYVVDRGVVDPVSVDVVDADGDGDVDVLSAAQGSDEIALHENYVE